jgi:hypothetical protein
MEYFIFNVDQRYVIWFSLNDVCTILVTIYAKKNVLFIKYLT